MATIFSQSLIRLRKEAGFHTAYKFYHNNGGKSVMLMSYREYLLLEQGKRMPDARRLQRLICCLRIIVKSGQANELVIAWLKTIVGEEIFGDILEPILYMKTETCGSSPLHKAVNRALTWKKHYITPEQLQVIYKNRDNYLCFLAMTNDEGAWSAETIGERLGLEKSAAARSMRELERIKILKKTKRGFYKCPLANAMLELPQPDTHTAAFFDKVKEYQENLITSGKTKFFIRGIIRADSAALSHFFPLMRLNISTVQTYNITNKTDKSALFAIEGKVVKLRDF